jgi:hypothetical protein
VASTPQSPAESFVDALGRRDFDAIGATLSPDVRFRALTPGSTWGGFGVDSTLAAIHKWFGEEEALEPVSSNVEEISDRTHLTYRFRVKNGEGWHLVEQQAYCIVDNDKITDISIVCSGFRPLPGDQS